MRKRLVWIMVIVTALVAALAVAYALLSSAENEDQQPQDTDGDGYPDEEDDFPEDANFHKRTLVNDSIDQWLYVGGYWGDEFHVSEVTKRIVWEWSANDTMVVWIGYDGNNITNNSDSGHWFHWFNESERNRQWYVEWVNPYSDRDIALYYLRVYLDE